MDVNNAAHATRLLTVNDVAQRANVNRATVYRWVERGVLPALRLGGVVRVDEREFEQWLYGNQLEEDLPPVTRSDLEPWMPEAS